MRAFYRTVLSGMAIMATACGDDGRSGPTAASPTASSIAVTLSTPIKIGATAQASATATLLSGQSQSITTGWQSDAQSVATVTDSGLVTGVGNGRATIFVLNGGRQGQQVVWVVPDYQGQWWGGLRVTSCTDSGDWARIGFCQEFAVGGTGVEFGLGVAQSGESLTASPNYGWSFSSTSVPSSIAADGSASFNAIFTGTSAPLMVDTAWRISSPSRGVLGGTVSEVWRVAGGAGEGRLEQDIVRTTRRSTTATASMAARTRAMNRARVLR